MGGWPELDARYDVGTLTPAMAFVVSLAYIAGADGVYMHEEEGSLAPFLRKHGLGGIRYDDLMMCAEEYLKQATLDSFLAEAPKILSEEQKLCILLNMAEASLADGHVAPEEETLLQQFLAAFDMTTDQIRPYLKVLRVKSNLAVFNP